VTDIFQHLFLLTDTMLYHIKRNFSDLIYQAFAKRLDILFL